MVESYLRLPKSENLNEKVMRRYLDKHRSKETLDKKVQNNF